MAESIRSGDQKKRCHPEAGEARRGPLGANSASARHVASTDGISSLLRESDRALERFESPASPTSSAALRLGVLSPARDDNASSARLAYTCPTGSGASECVLAATVASFVRRSSAMSSTSVPRDRVKEE